MADAVRTGSTTTRVVIVGQGYVGLPVSMAAVRAGYDVVGYDLEHDKIAGMRNGVSHIEDVTDADIQAALATGRFHPTDEARDLVGFDYAVITVPTPLRDGVPDISYIRSATDTLARYLRPEATVILESTTYPGTTESIVGPLLEEGSGLVAGIDFHLGYSPERIDPGNEVWTFERTPKIVSGINETSLKSVESLYEQLVETVVPAKGTKEAEMAKLLENTYRHVNIALVNELAINARGLGIDIWDVIGVASSKPFGFMPFFPGPGVGGHCLPIDPSYLSWQFEQELGTVSRFVKIANDINNGMPSHVVGRVQSGLNDRRKAVNGSRILVLGVAYKRNSSDARETPATGVVSGLLDLGADVRVHDPHVGDYEYDGAATRVELTKTELTAADAVILITDHDDVDYDFVLKHSDYVFDARNRLDGTNVEIL